MVVIFVYIFSSTFSPVALKCDFYYAGNETASLRIKVANGILHGTINLNVSPSYAVDARQDVTDGERFGGAASQSSAALRQRCSLRQYTVQMGDLS